MIKKGQILGPVEPVYEQDETLPITPESLLQFLISAFASNYKDKFGERHIPAKNVFSVSSLVSGPGTTVSNYRRTLEATDEEGEEAKVFSYSMFRGTAVHDHSNEKLAKFYSYSKMNVREEFEYAWKDPAFKTIIIQGHPDLVHYGRLTHGDVVFCEDSSAGILLEIKSISSAVEDLKKLEQYKTTVIKKAKRQAGCYAMMLSNELHRPHYAYVVIFDDRPDKHPLTEEDKKAGAVMINDGTFRLDLDERIIKRGFVYDSSLRVYPLSRDEIFHGYNYCKWSAIEAARILEEEQK